jgi:peptidoglycan-associated lipoprotein
MKTHLSLMLTVSVFVCWGCASSAHHGPAEPSFVMETFLPPPLLDLGPKTRSSALMGASSNPMQSEKMEWARPNVSVHFGFNQFAIPNSEMSVVKSHGEYLLQSPSSRVQLAGHTDENGDDAYNLQLGKKRAQSVKDFLLKMGVEEDRLELFSFGKSQPIDPSHNKSAWQQNRRVEFQYIDPDVQSKK